jgi:hypothetical protein
MRISVVTVKVTSPLSHRDTEKNSAEMLIVNAKQQDSAVSLLPWWTLSQDAIMLVGTFD